MKVLVFLLFISDFISLYSQKENVLSDTLNFNKNITTIGSYINGKKQGIWIYLEGDRILRIASYVDDNLEGKMFLFYENGNIKQILNFNKNMLNGDSYFYSSEGKLLAILTYEYRFCRGYKYYIIDDESPPLLLRHGYEPPY